MAEIRSGFIAFVGRPNVGKSSLVNTICGHKVSIVSDKPQTTRHRIMGVLTRADAQLVFVDTPGLHKPVSALGERVNATALDSSADVDVQCLVLDATKSFGSGDRWVADRLHMPTAVVVVNKIDAASKQQVLAMLAAASELGAEAYFPVSARSGEGIDQLVDHLADSAARSGRSTSPTTRSATCPRSSTSPNWYASSCSPSPATNCPYSIATRVTEWEWPRIRVDIVVERDSQKGMVIGKGGSVLKEVGKRARAQMPEGVYLELRVKVDKDWQRKPDRVERLGY